ncbi:MAG: Rne/Rng family ribonuclease [Candidatus Binatia bacterium]
MGRHILINVAPWEARVAVLEDATLAELHIERHAEQGVAGNVYRGKVVRVLPGMQAAFLDIGLEKAAFIHVSDLASPDVVPPDVAEDVSDAEQLEAALEPVRPRRAPRDPRPIEERLQRGDELIVQVSKEPIGTKGARVTAQISLPGRFLVYMPGTRHIGLSRRLEDPTERDRLRTIVEAVRPAEGGLIVRTACEGATERELQDDVQFLTRLWENVRDRATTTPAPALLHQDLDVVLRTVRDLFTTDVEVLTVDTPNDHARVLEFVQALMPRLADRVQLYTGTTPLFDAYGIEPKIARALERRVWLKSGGYLIFDQTESLTTVDVNTGRYVGKHDQEETILRTNLEAAQQVVQQLRLRNIGGIIVIDFIDMESLENRQKVLDVLQEATRRDKARSTVLRISELGLVQMTRKRTRESLEQLLTSPCPHCRGTGRERSTEALAYEALRRVQREVVGTNAGTAVRLRVPRDVVTFLVQHQPRHVQALARLVGRTIEVVPDDGLPRLDAMVQLVE